MPELPEVETVRRQLARVLEGSKIQQVETSVNSYFFVTPPKILVARLVGRRVDRLERRGKYLIAHLDNRSRLLLHLGMTGQFVAGHLPRDPHVHVILHLNKRKIVTLRDVRKFGKIEWIDRGAESERLTRLGPDALSVDTAFLQQKFRARKVPIKTAILDQKIWAGVGNIYADEGLYRARISPMRPAHRLTRPQIDRLRHEIQSLLIQAIEAGGSTINDYLKPDGELGGFQNFHVVYGKQDRPCPTCGRPIVRVALGGRGTHFCSKCQR